MNHETSWRDDLCPGCRKNKRGQSSPYCTECYISWQKKPASPPAVPMGLLEEAEKWLASDQARYEIDFPVVGLVRRLTAALRTRGEDRV